MTPEEIDFALSDLETSLERLHALYNQYFMGIEKMEPLVPRKNLDRKINVLRRAKIRSTAQRFRFQTQIQKYNTQSNYWRRVCRQIEEGTYQRHVMLAKRRQEERVKNLQLKDAEAASEARADSQASKEGLDEVYPDFIDIVLESTQESPSLLNLDLDAMSLGLDEPFSKAADSPTFIPSSPISVVDDLDDPFAEVPRNISKAPASPLEKPKTNIPKPVAKAPAPAPEPAKLKVPRPAAKAAAPPTKKQDFDDERAKKIYRTYLAARQKCNEPTKNLTLEKVVRSLKKQYDEKGGEVDFKVVIRNGKAAIKTVKN